jgi:undecaprenyl-diphosphatase
LNEYLLSVLLGIIEGLTEFLPVSSTAHLRIAESLLGINLADGYWKMFSIVIQLGAILCLPIYFRKRIADFVSTFPRGSRGDRTAITHPLTLVLLAFFCTAVPAFLMTKIIGKHLESLVVMGLSLVIGGIVMWIVDAAFATPRQTPLGGPTTDMNEVTIGQSIWIGLCQVFSAVFPGTSRSMATIAAGQLTGMSRSAALEFSFFVSIPTMVAATCYDLLKAMRHHPGEPSALGAIQMNVHSWTLLAIGFVVSFIVAYGVVAWFMNWVRNRGFVPFAIYRIVFGAAVLWWALKP